MIHKGISLKLNCWGHVKVLLALYYTDPSQASLQFLYKVYDDVSLFGNNKLITTGNLALPDLDWVGSFCSHSPPPDIVFDMMLCFDISKVVASFPRDVRVHFSI